jgi:hypothetical protein
MNYFFVLIISLAIIQSLSCGEISIIPSSPTSRSRTVLKYRIQKGDLENLLSFYCIQTTPESTTKIRTLLATGASPNIFFVIDLIANNQRVRSHHILPYACIEANRYGPLSLLCDYGLHKDPHLAWLACCDYTGSPERLAILDRLMVHNINVHLPSSRASYQTPLMAAAAHHPAFVARLLREKVAVNQQDNHGKTALIHCTHADTLTTTKRIPFQGRTIMKLLLDHGANPFLLDQTKKTAFHYAQGASRCFLIRYSQYPKITTTIVSTIKFLPPPLAHLITSYLADDDRDMAEKDFPQWVKPLAEKEDDNACIVS